MKNTLNEIKSLMLRMENTPNGGSNFVNEASCKWRMVVGEDDFYDLLSGLKQGNRVTFGYVSQAKIVVPKGKRLNPATNRMNQFDDYETLGRNLGETEKLINVIKLTIYNLPWQTQEDVNNKYGEWKQKRDALNTQFGIETAKPRYQTQTNKFNEKGGISQYGGENQELTAHTYTNLNMHNIKPINTSYYLVFENGSIKPIDVEKLEILPYKSSQTAIDKLKAAGATDDDVAPLVGMQYQRFEHSHILFISATPDNGIPTLLINNKLSDKIGGITHANGDAIINLAKERYAKFCNI